MGGRLGAGFARGKHGGKGSRRPGPDLACIGPDTLEILTGEDRPREGDVEAVALTISGPDVTEAPPHGAGLEKATAKEDTRWWTRAMYVTVPDGIVAKGKTPFAPLWSDRYPAEKEK